MTLKEQFSLLNKCKSKDITRPSLEHVYGDGERLMSTNGHIMCVVKSKLDEGFYTIDEKTTNIGKLDVKDLKFPDTKRVIPKAGDREKYAKYQITIPKLKISGNRPVACLVDENGSIIFTDQPDQYKSISCFDFKYLSLLANMTINIWVKDKSSAAVLSDEGGFTDSSWFFLLMPRRS